MTLIEIREKQQIAGAEFSAELVFDHGAPYPITIKDPFTEEQEKRLEWYFEQHLRFPFTDQVQAKQAGGIEPETADVSEPRWRNRSFSDNKEGCATISTCLVHRAK
jgi:hypothetical protein